MDTSLQHRFRPAPLVTLNRAVWGGAALAALIALWAWWAPVRTTPAHLAPDAPAAAVGLAPNPFSAPAQPAAPPRPVAPAAKAPEPPPAAPRVPLAQRAARLKLVGVAGDEAIIEDGASGRTLTLSAGQDVNGIVVERVLADRIILASEGETMELVL